MRARIWQKEMMDQCGMRLEKPNVPIRLGLDSFQPWKSCNSGNPQPQGSRDSWSPKWGPNLTQLPHKCMCTGPLGSYWSPSFLLFVRREKGKGFTMTMRVFRGRKNVLRRRLGTTSGAVQMDFQEGWMSCAAKYTHYRLMSHSGNAGCVEIHGQGPWVGRCSPDTLSTLN